MPVILSAEPSPACAWIDFRSRYRTRYTLFTEWYTATQLQDVLNEVGFSVMLALDTQLIFKIFSDKELPELYRQLMYVLLVIIGLTSVRLDTHCFI